MADTVSVRLERSQIQAIEEMDDDEVADNQSEALRMALNAGLTELGYMNGGEYDSLLRINTRRAGLALGGAGMVVLGLSLFGPLAGRLIGVSLLLAAMTCYGVDRLLALLEPGVTLKFQQITRARRAEDRARTDGGEDQ